MKKITIEIADGYDSVLTCTAIGSEGFVVKTTIFVIDLDTYNHCRVNADGQTEYSWEEEE